MTECTIPPKSLKIAPKPRQRTMIVAMAMKTHSKTALVLFPEACRCGETQNNGPLQDVVRTMAGTIHWRSLRLGMARCADTSFGKTCQSTTSTRFCACLLMLSAAQLCTPHFCVNAHASRLRAAKEIIASNVREAGTTGKLVKTS